MSPLCSHHLHRSHKVYLALTYKHQGGNIVYRGRGRGGQGQTGLQYTVFGTIHTPIYMVQTLSGEFNKENNHNSSSTTTQQQRLDRPGSLFYSELPTKLGEMREFGKNLSTNPFPCFYSTTGPRLRYKHRPWTFEEIFPSEVKIERTKKLGTCVELVISSQLKERIIIHENSHISSPDINSVTSSSAPWPIYL